MTDLTQKYITTTELIQNEIKSLKTKQEIITYLTAVKDFCASTMKITRLYMKGMR